MQTYSGRITVKTFESGDTSDVLTTFNDDTLKKLSDHTHEGSGAGDPIHGTNAIQAGTIDTASYKDASITSAKLAAQLSFATVSNDAYIKWRNNANSADLNVIKVNTSDNLEFEQSIDKIQFSNNITVKGKTSGGADYNLFKVNLSDQWEFENDAYSQDIFPITDSTYALGSTSLRWSNIHSDSIRFVGGGTDLNHYETGTWTPVVSGGSAAGSGSYATQVGTFVRTGDYVDLWWELVWSGHTGTGVFTITGLPYNSSTSPDVTVGTASLADFSIGAEYSLMSWIQTSIYNNRIRIVSTRDNTTATAANMDAAASCWGWIRYKVA